METRQEMGVKKGGRRPINHYFNFYYITCRVQNALPLTIQQTKRVKHYIPASSAVEHVGFTWDFIEKQQQTKPVSSVLLALSAELLKVKVSAM